MTIEFRDTQTWNVECRMNDVPGTLDDGVLIAQKYLRQFAGLTACVLTESSEVVVSGATEWQKRNG